MTAPKGITSRSAHRRVSITHDPSLGGGTGVVVDVVVVGVVGVVAVEVVVDVVVPAGGGGGGGAGCCVVVRVVVTVVRRRGVVRSGRSRSAWAVAAAAGTVVVLLDVVADEVIVTLVAAPIVVVTGTGAGSTGCGRACSVRPEASAATEANTVAITTPATPRTAYGERRNADAASTGGASSVRSSGPLVTAR